MIIRLIFLLIPIMITSSDMTIANDFKPKKVGILVYDGVYLLDFCGPMEVFSDTRINDSAQGFEVFAVAASMKEIKCHTGARFLPDYSIGNCPQPDILVVPGGMLDLAKSDKKLAEWLKSTANKAEITMSVCTGAFILADLGLLDGLEATTWFGAAERLRKLYPSIKVLENKRITDNGRIITTAGVSAGLDGALFIVEKLYGIETAGKTAKYIEYDYNLKNK
ncbi:MAG: hypothetical protein QG635_1000 [Bacteroidota bacterium]|nr:hypothetical protein [Bacteroidota bacterium]